MVSGDSREIGERIWNIRDQIGLSRNELAEKAGVCENTIYNIETGERGFTVDVLKRICTALEISSDYVLYGERTSLERELSLQGIVDNVSADTLKEVGKILIHLSDSK
ncbi:helix-turn-helix transcriptional regulator [Vallitalea pronyensis]|uniref:Helix-turn-helix transcriptional regulator n=1 Tax=Vallitalea pronyensis TaxID=1348613 RepID=A0A8J8MNJ7_9FIRM|nr:helix-turn-helix transcriptional regulator [Vallitalea pronyensis]QUI24841.1 helix-turn-helix transcriptional regulator [Vallitalea pronyensis]